MDVDDFFVAFGVGDGEEGGFYLFGGAEAELAEEEQVGLVEVGACCFEVVELFGGEDDVAEFCGHVS